MPLPVSKCRRIITLQFIGAWMSLASLMCFTILTFSASSIYLSRPLKTADVLLSVITHLALFCCFKVSNGAHLYLRQLVRGNSLVPRKRWSIQQPAACSRRSNFQVV